MNLLNIHRVKVGDREFPVKITNRAMILYEKMTGSTVVSFEGTEKLLQFFYCTAQAGAKATGEDFKYSFDEFLDVIDDYYSETLINFSNALMAEMGGGEKKQSKKSE
jgi:hypothetical protein